MSPLVTLLTAVLAVSACTAIVNNRREPARAALVPPSETRGARPWLPHQEHSAADRRHRIPYHGGQVFNTRTQAPGQSSLDPLRHGNTAGPIRHRQLQRRPLPRPVGRHGHESRGRRHRGHKQRGPKRHGLRRHGHKHHGPRHHGPKHHGHRHHGPRHHGSKHHGPKRHGPKHHGHRHHEQDHGQGRVRRHLHHAWKKLNKIGKGIKTLFSHHSRRPRPGYSVNWPTPGVRRPAATETPAVRRSPAWPGWSDPRDRGARSHPVWPTTTTRTTTPTTTTTIATPTTTTTTPTTTTTAPTTTTPTTTTATTTLSPPSRGSGGILVITTQPRITNGRPTCRAGFSYHAPSGMCHERCPTGASYRPPVCLCDRPGFAVDFFLWRCAPKGRAIE